MKQYDNKQFSHEDIFWICRNYRESDDKDEQVKILSELYSCNKSTIMQILDDHPNCLIQSDSKELESGKLHNSTPVQVVIPDQFQSLRPEELSDDPPLRFTPKGKIMYDCDLIRWVKSQLNKGVDISDICSKIPSSSNAVRASLIRHGITWPDGRKTRYSKSTEVTIAAPSIEPKDVRKLTSPKNHTDDSTNIDLPKSIYDEATSIQLKAIRDSMLCIDETMNSDDNVAVKSYKVGKYTSTVLRTINELISKFEEM